MNFTIVVDYGKPYEIKVSSEDQLRKELRKLKKMWSEQAEEFPFFDVWVYDENEVDITSKYISEGGEVQ